MNYFNNFQEFCKKNNLSKAEAIEYLEAEIKRRELIAS